MTKEESAKLKIAQLEIMDEIHRLCVENDIQYYMVGGTLIGAVRHQGFIPWDVDIDIAMFRNDYIKFKDICLEKLNSRFLYRDYLNSKNFNHPHALICINNTELYSKYDVYNPQAENLGIYVDIFPLDNAPDDLAIRIEHEKKLKKIEKIKNYRLPYYYSEKKIRRFAKSVLRFALSWKTVENINSIQQAEMMRYSMQDTQAVCNMAGRYSYSKECHKKSIFGQAVLLPFDGRFYYAPEQYDKYLTQIYGDYMKLPPIEQQVANLDIFSSVKFDF